VNASATVQTEKSRGQNLILISVTLINLPLFSHHANNIVDKMMQEMSDEYKVAQARLMLEQASDVDIIVTTALIPGRKAPILVTQEMLSVLKAGSVIVDLAASNGGNCESSVPDEVITTPNGVTIIGYTDLPSRLASTSSTLFGTNVAKVSHSQLMVIPPSQLSRQ
jgi:NAD/NADP transhydrogenase alpha subunit